MKFLRYIVATLLIVSIAHTAMAAFTTSSTDDNKNKYSLKHLNKLTNNYLTFQNKYRTAQTASTFFYSREANGLSMSAPVSTYLGSQKTSTTYIYPYKYTVKIPKFKVPCPSAIIQIILFLLDYPVPRCWYRKFCCRYRTKVYISCNKLYAFPLFIFRFVFQNKSWNAFELVWILCSGSV